METDSYCVICSGNEPCSMHDIEDYITSLRFVMSKRDEYYDDMRHVISRAKSVERQTGCAPYSKYDRGRRDAIRAIFGTRVEPHTHYHCIVPCKECEDCEKHSKNISS